MIIRNLRNTALLAVLLFASGCAPQLLDKWGQPIMQEPGVYTLTNVHFYNGRGGVPTNSTINYTGGFLVPRCTEVYLDDINEKNLVLERSGLRHHYQLGRQTPEHFHDMIRKYFGTRCSDADLANLNKADRLGIKDGVVRSGMSKQGVIYAIGYPPSHATPSLSSNEWIYWVTRTDRIAVRFDNNGLVRQVKD